MGKESEAAGARQLIVCCDGTNNTLTGHKTDTNVLRLFETLAARNDPRQLLYYDPGVGSPDAFPATDVIDSVSRSWRRIAGMASGRGVYENIAEAYLFLMRHWNEADQIWLFGFSRGAFTARSVAGMVNLFGILRPEHETLLPLLLRVYFSNARPDARRGAMRRRHFKAQLAGRQYEGENEVLGRGDVAAQIRAHFTTPAGRDAWVHFVGTWDTVESVGMPGMSIRISGPATVHGKRWRHVRHALALDEHRWTFLPRLYTEDNFVDERQSLTQLWFRGVHSDVGGGYEQHESRLANEALAWMVDEAIACELRCPPMPPQGEVLVHDPVHSMPWWTLTALTQRDTRRAHDATARRHVTPAAHASVARLGHGLPSVWARRRGLVPVLLASSGLLTGAVLPHRCTMPPAPWAEASEGAARLAWAQLQMLWRVPQGQWERLWLQLSSTPNLGWALLGDLLVMASAAYLLGRWTGRGYTRLSGYRDIGQPRSAWYRLGAALPMAIGADLAEDVTTALALALDGPFLPALLWLGGAAAAMKWLGFTGCAALIVAAALRRRR